MPYSANTVGGVCVGMSLGVQPGAVPAPGTFVRSTLLYVAGDGLWLLPTLAAKPVEIATPLFPPHEWPAYYGQVAWTAQFARWSS